MVLDSNARHANYCSKCGHKFRVEDEKGIHYDCPNCPHFSGYNHKPVNIVLQPVRRANDVFLLTGKRAVKGDGGFGKFALPAGWLDAGEEIPAGAARELEEEHGLIVDPYSLKLLQVTTGNRLDQVCFFWIAPEIEEKDLPQFTPCDEVSEQKLIAADDVKILAFDGHRYFASQFFEGSLTFDPSVAGRTLANLLAV